MNSSKYILEADKQIVIHVTTSLGFGGVEKHIEILASASLSGNMIHYFCAIGGGGSTADYLNSINVRVDCLEKPFYIPSYQAFWALYLFFKDIRPAVVHTHGAEANFHGLLAAMLAGVPVRIAEEIGIPQHTWRTRKVFTQVYRAAHRVVGISDAVTRWLVTRGEVPEKKVVRIYNPVRLPKDVPTIKNSSEIFRIGFVGRLEPVKNALGLIDALQLLLAKNIAAELWIVGDGSEKNKIEMRIRELGLDSNVHLLGYQSDPTVYIRDCDVYVQPSISEGFGLALVEAMGCGLPVIATAVGGAPEIISHGKTGWLLDNSTPEAIVAALVVAFAAGHSTLRLMGQEAKKSISGRFVPAVYLNQIESLYQNLLRNKKVGDSHE